MDFNVKLLIFIIILLFIVLLKNCFEKLINEKISKVLPPIGILYLGTGIWCLIIINLWLNQESHLELNAWGDFLAGFFAPLLFAWLVYGVSLQKIEFSNALKSFTFQYDEMKAQNEQIVIQQINTWFNRNIKTIQTIKLTIFQIPENKFNSITEIAFQLEKDINEKDTTYLSYDMKYFNIYDDLKNILDTILYIQEHLNEQYIKYENKDKIKDSIKEIQKEFELLYRNEISDIKKILTIAYFLIALNKKEGYEKYSAYSNWINDYTDIYNEITKINKTVVDDILSEVLKKYNDLNLNFNTGKVRN